MPFLSGLGRTTLTIAPCARPESIIDRATSREKPVMLEEVDRQIRSQSVQAVSRGSACIAIAPRD